MMPIHRDTTYGILSQLQLVTTFKMTDEVMPFLKLLLDSGPVHICVTCRRPRLQRLLTEEIHGSTRVSYKHSHRGILLLQAYMYMYVQVVKIALALSVAYWILAEYWRLLYNDCTGQAPQLSGGSSPCRLHSGLFFGSLLYPRT